MDATQHRDHHRPIVYLVDDRLQTEGTSESDTDDDADDEDEDESVSSFADGDKVPSDEWCHRRYMAADPRYYSSRTWPLLEDTVVPQQSCMEARYRTSYSLLASNDTNYNNSVSKPKVKWYPSLALIDLDYVDNSHNTHFAMDTLWLLDAALFQRSLSLRQRPGMRTHRARGHEDALLLTNGTRVYMPQTRADFERQTEFHLNRLIFSIILRKDPLRLYSHLSPSSSSAEKEKHPIQRPASPASPDEERRTRSILQSFPEVERDEEVVFHHDIVDDKNTDLVCTSRMTAGFKTGFTADEKVCREIRTQSYKVFGIERPKHMNMGQIGIPQPTKNVLVFNRHVTRKIANGQVLADQLREKLHPLGVNVSYVSTADLHTAEDWVRTFSSAGVIVSPHGSHNMGIVWMQRYRYVFVALFFNFPTVVDISKNHFLVSFLLLTLVLFFFYMFCIYAVVL